MTSCANVALFLLMASMRLTLAQPPPASGPTGARSLGSLLSRLFTRALVREAPQDTAWKIAGGSGESRPLALVQAAQQSAPNLHIIKGSDAEDEDEDDGGTASALLQVGAQAHFGQGNSIFHGVSKTFFEDEDAPMTNGKLQSAPPAVHPLQDFAPNDVGHGAVPAFNPLEGPPHANISGDRALLQHANPKSLAAALQHRASFADEDEQEGSKISMPNAAEDIRVKGLSLTDDSNEDASGGHSNEDAAATSLNNLQAMLHEAKATQEAEEEVDALNGEAANEKPEETQMELEMERNGKKEREREEDEKKEEVEKDMEETKEKRKADNRGGLKETEHEKEKVKVTDADTATGIQAHSTQLLSSQVEPARMIAKRKRRVAEALAFVEAQADMGGQELDEIATLRAADQSVDEPDEVPYPYGPEDMAPASKKAPKFSLLAERQHGITPTVHLGQDEAALRGEVVAQDARFNGTWPSKHDAAEQDAKQHELAENKPAKHEAAELAEREAAEHETLEFMTAKRKVSEHEAKLREAGKLIAEDAVTQRGTNLREDGQTFAEQQATQHAAELREEARLILERTATQQDALLRKASELAEGEAMLRDAQMRLETASAVPAVLDQRAFSAASRPSSSPSRQASPRSSVAPELSFLSVGSSTAAGREAAVTAPATFGPEHSACTPKCTWQCESPRCDEVCEPECEAPRCETRCAGVDLSGCAMECQEPHCVVTCPNTTCLSEGCPTCTTTCSEPMCKLKCIRAQPCRNVCEQPNCRWNCRAPDECSAPKCEMACESPKDCMGATFQVLPPLQPGETSVQSFAAPGSALQTAAATSPVHALRGGPQPPSTVPIQLMTMPGGAGMDARLQAIQRSASVLPVMTPGYQRR